MVRYRRFKILLAFVLVAQLVTQPVLAWNDKGHMVVARIAYQRLNDAQRANIFEILKRHPHYETYLAKDRPVEASEPEWVFLRAATWCDNIRPPKNFAGDLETHPKYKFHRGPWHYMDYEFRPGITKSERIPLPADTDVLKQLELTMSILKKTTTVDPGQAADVSDDANQAVRICWLFHLVGDLHQPLHSTALVDPNLFPLPPHGDDGGNKIAVRSARYQQPIKLHAYWDQLLGFDAFFPIIRKTAEEIVLESDCTPASLQANLERKLFLDWTYESNDEAKAKIYSNGELKFARWDDFNEKRITAEEVPQLPEAYEAAATKFARQRVALAGYRLADCIQQLP